MQILCDYLTSLWHVGLVVFSFVCPSICSPMVAFGHGVVTTVCFLGVRVCVLGINRYFLFFYCRSNVHQLARWETQLTHKYMACSLVLYCFTVYVLNVARGERTPTKAYATRHSRSNRRFG